MKKIFFLLCISLFAFASNLHASTDYICLLDMSGSLSGVSDCDGLSQNIKAIRKIVEGLNTKDRIVVIGFGWQGKPKEVVSKTMPNNRGGSGKLIKSSRNEILAEISKFLKEGKREVDDSATDIVGSLKYVGTIMPDLRLDQDVRLLVFSDGIQTLNLNALTPGDSNIGRYTAALHAYLQNHLIATLSGVDLVWYGNICPLQRMSHSEYATLQEMLKREWIEYLKKSGVASVTFRVLY